MVDLCVGQAKSTIRPPPSRSAPGDPGGVETAFMSMGEVFPGRPDESGTNESRCQGETVAITAR